MPRAVVPSLLALVVVLAAAPAAQARVPDLYVLPGDRVFPEGVTLQPGSDRFFVSSTQDGTVFRGALGRRRTAVFLPPRRHGRVNAVGVRASRTRLVVAGGVANLIFAYDLRTRRLVRRWSTGSGGLVNDVAIAPDGDAYATDSMRGLVFRIPARALARPRRGTATLRPWVRVGADRAPSGYTNGIVAAGRRHLLVSVLSNGAILRIDRRTRAVRTVGLGGEELILADGMALDGRRLYVVNSANRVTEVRLSRDRLRGRVVRHITSPRFRLPTTVAIAGRRLLVVNSQFNERGGTPVLPFTVASVPRP
jgi:Cu-Zn family superoxide dismutase